MFIERMKSAAYKYKNRSCRKETARCSVFFLRPMTLIVICFSLRKVKAVIAPAGSPALRQQSLINYKQTECETENK